MWSFGPQNIEIFMKISQNLHGTKIFFQRKNFNVSYFLFPSTSWETLRSKFLKVRFFLWDFHFFFHLTILCVLFKKDTFSFRCQSHIETSIVPTNFVDSFLGSDLNLFHLKQLLFPKIKMFKHWQNFRKREEIRMRRLFSETPANDGLFTDKFELNFSHTIL